MKKLLLLIASGSIALTAVAQQKATMFSASGEEQIGRRNLRVNTLNEAKKGAPVVAAKGTAANRFYDYSHWLDTTLSITTSDRLTYSGMPLWADTLAQIAGTTTFNNTFVSAAAVFDASFDGFNNPDYYPGQMQITNSDAFTIKSINLFGVYGFNTAKSLVKDTIRLTFVKGTGAAPASDDIFSGYSLAGGGHYGTVDFLDVHYDSVRNYMTNAVNMPGLGAPCSMVVDVILDNSTATPAWGDTTDNGIWVRNIALPGAGLAVPANGYAAVSISFRSGDGSFPTTAPGAVVWNNDGTFAYNMFRPLIAYRTDDVTTGDPQWLTYTDPQAPDNNANCGYFRRLPAYLNGWGGTYVPMWAWSTGGGANASYLQHPLVQWEVECPSCGTVPDGTSTVTNVNNNNTASAYPNPAVNELNVPFTLNNSSDVTVTLTNVVGQVVATQNFTNVASGNAVFNTAAMANGVYTYSVIAGGQRTTGRVSIAH